MIKKLLTLVIILMSLMPLKSQTITDSQFFLYPHNLDNSNLSNLAKSIGIPESRIYTMGSNKAKIEKIIELEIGTTGVKA